MTTIDHQQAARSTYISPALPGMIRDLWKSDPSERSVQTALALAGDLIQELIDLRAATPHLRAEWLADRLGDIARAVQGSTCNILYESGDWEAGTVGFYWCETHRPDAEPKFEGDQSAWEYDNGVCPDVLKAAHAVLALLEGGGE